MKKILSMLMAFALVLSFAACGGSDEPIKDNTDIGEPDITEEETKEPEPEPEETDKSYADLVESISWAEAFCAVAYVGFVEEPSSNDYLSIFERQSELMELYPFVAKIPPERIVETDGYDLYCIVPGSLDCSVKVEELSFPEDEEAREPVIGEILYESKTGEPIIVRCNESDIFANLLITITAPDGTEKKLSPYLSLMDGSLAGINEDESGLNALDFSGNEINLDSFYTFDELVDGEWTAYHYFDDGSTYVLNLDFFYDEANQPSVEFFYGPENSEIDEIFTGTVRENWGDDGNWDGGFTLDMHLTGGLFYAGDPRPHVCSYKFQKMNEEFDEAFALHYGWESPFFIGTEYQPFYFAKAKG